MYWLAYLILSLVLYLPYVGLAQRLWAWAEQQIWTVPLVGWRWPAWLAYAFWLAVAYLALGTLLAAAHRRLPQDAGLARLALRLSRADLGSLDVVAAIAAASVVLLAWPVLPALGNMYGWQAAISPPVAALAALYLPAEALRLAEHNLWVDRAFATWRRRWLVEHGHG